MKEGLVFFKMIIAKQYAENSVNAASKKELINQKL
jgi:hypothetical protein